jgi:hypothetical protein
MTGPRYLIVLPDPGLIRAKNKRYIGIFMSLREGSIFRSKRSRLPRKIFWTDPEIHENAGDYISKLRVKIKSANYYTGKPTVGDYISKLTA